MKKIMLAGIIPVVLCGMLTACGKEKKEVTEQPDITETIEETTAEE